VPRKASSTKAATAPAPAPKLALPPYRDPRFENVNKGLTLTAAHFDKLIAAGCYYDAAAADRVVAFFENYTRHSKGEWAGQPLKLSDWQEYHTRNIFGWKRPDGTRVFRLSYIEVPRKNGKSTWISGIGIYLTVADREQGAEVYSAANDREQAAIVFESAKSMVTSSPELLKRCKPLRRAITVEQMGNSYKVLSADVQNKDGFNSHGILFDELHKQRNRDLWDVLITSTGARRQPLMIAITTAGFDQETICWEQHESARKVAEGITEDFQFYPVIYCTDPKDDFRDPEVWKRANPNLGVSLKLETLREACQKAMNEPAFENTFRRNHLNQWTQQASRWIPMIAWDAITDPVDAQELLGEPCYGGLDLASTIDIAALDLIFPRRLENGTTVFKLLPFFWIPADNVQERSRRDGVPYDLWVKKGLVRTTPGNIIDYDQIVKDIGELLEKYQLLELAYDPWNASKIITDLEEAGVKKLVPMRQGYASMSAPSKEFLRLTLAGQLHHGGHQVLRWMADSVIVIQDPAGNIKPDKSKRTRKIDGIVAGIMALDRAVRNEGAGGKSVYETRGLLTL
jgi:phage terminase large subunit-like protein